MKIKKYIITQTNEPVDVGDTISRTKKINTSFGTIETSEYIVVTESIIPSLIADNIIKKVENKQASIPNNHNVGYYVDKLAKKYKKSFEEVTDWLDATNNVYPKAVLDILLYEIATDFYKKDKSIFENVEQYYSIRPRDGKVGKVVNPTKYTPVFKSVEDAEAAREILKDQLKLMYGE